MNLEKGVQFISPNELNMVEFKIKPIHIIFFLVFVIFGVLLYYIIDKHQILLTSLYAENNNLQKIPYNYEQYNEELNIDKGDDYKSMIDFTSMISEDIVLNFVTKAEFPIPKIKFAYDAIEKLKNLKT